MDSTYTQTHADDRTWWGAEVDEVRCGGLECFSGEQVKEVGGGMKHLHLEGGADAWNRRERTTLLVEQIMRSALPFWVEV